ncbi:hypothetical protein ACN38_g12300, partial [Penicillium nordicum]
STVDV